MAATRLLHGLVPLPRAQMTGHRRGPSLREARPLSRGPCERTAHAVGSKPYLADEDPRAAISSFARSDALSPSASASRRTVLKYGARRAPRSRSEIPRRLTLAR